MGRPRKIETLCWNCDKAFCGCKWCKSLEPIDGWEAIYSPIPSQDGKLMDSFIVIRCPEYEGKEEKKIDPAEQSKRNRERKRKYMQRWRERQRH